MKNITIFKNYYSIREPYFISVEYALNRIKTGTDRLSIEIIRAEPDKAKQNELKKILLPLICFSGRFTKRKSSAIIGHSGIIALDMDKFINQAELLKYRESLLISDKKPFILALFITPSALGLKILVRIPSCIEMEHKKYFNAMKVFFNDTQHWDAKVSDLARGHFSSYDPDLYFNPEAEQWCEMAEDKPYAAPAVPENVLKSEIEKVKKLEIWFEKKYSMNEGERNNNLFIYASAHNDFGVSKQFSEQFFLEKYGNADTEKEILKLISSAYKKPGGIKFFKDLENASVTIQTGNNKKKKITWENVNYSNKDRVRTDICNNYPNWISFAVKSKYTGIEIESVKR